MDFISNSEVLKLTMKSLAKFSLILLFIIRLWLVLLLSTLLLKYVDEAAI